MKIDFAKRRRVMERSQLLGHCICDVQRPCPCDVLREQNICPCAGERPEPVDISQVKLTQLVRNAGCASKISPADLDAVLGRLPAVEDPAVISGQAGVALVGGHSVKDDEIKLGFAITGVINPAVAAALEKPNAGDALVLTKPLGTGVLAFCRQIGRDYPAGMAAAEVSMAALNQAAAEAMKEAGASACTDVTGF